MKFLFQTFVVAFVLSASQAQHTSTNRTTSIEMPSKHKYLDSYLVLDKQPTNIRRLGEMHSFKHVYAYSLREGEGDSMSEGEYVVGVRSNNEYVWIVNASFVETYNHEGKVHAISPISEKTWLAARNRARLRGYKNPSVRDLIPKVYVSARSGNVHGQKGTPRYRKRYAMR